MNNISISVATGDKLKEAREHYGKHYRSRKSLPLNYLIASLSGHEETISFIEDIYGFYLMWQNKQFEAAQLSDLIAKLPEAFSDVHGINLDIKPVKFPTKPQTKIRTTMRTQVIFYDILNNEWLQFIDLDPIPAKMRWTSVPSQCSFYEEEDIPKILKAIDEQYDGECWIEPKIIHVKGQD